MLKIATLLCQPMLPASHWVAEFSVSTFSKCDSTISVFDLHNLEGLPLEYVHSSLTSPLPIHLALQADRGKLSEAQGWCKEAPFRVGLEVRRILSP